MSQDELLFSEDGDCEQGPFRVVLVPKHEVYNFSNSPGFVRGTVDIEDRDGGGKFKEIEPRAFGIVAVNKFSSRSTVYQGINRLDISGIHCLKFDF